MYKNKVKPFFAFHADHHYEQVSPAAWFKILFFISTLIFPVISSYFVLSGDLDMTKSFGSGELAWTLAESRNSTYLLDIETWFKFPTPLVQAFYTLIFISFPNIYLIQIILLSNIVIMTGSSVIIFYISKYFFRYEIAAFSALLALAAHTSMFSGITGSSTAIAAFFATLSIFLAIKATKAIPPLLWIVFSGLSLTIATTARIEMVFIGPIVTLLYPLSFFLISLEYLLLRNF